MSISFACPNCGHKLRSGDDRAGTTAYCPHCKQQVTIPGGQPAAPTAAHVPPVPEATAPGGRGRLVLALAGLVVLLAAGTVAIVYFAGLGADPGDEAAEHPEPGEPGGPPSDLKAVGFLEIPPQPSAPAGAKVLVGVLVSIPGKRLTPTEAAYAEMKKQSPALSPGREDIHEVRPHRFKLVLSDGRELPGDGLLFSSADGKGVIPKEYSRMDMLGRQNNEKMYTFPVYWWLESRDCRRPYHVRYRQERAVTVPRRQLTTGEAIRLTTIELRWDDRIPPEVLDIDVSKINAGIKETLDKSLKDALPKLDASTIAKEALRRPSTRPSIHKAAPEPPPVLPPPRPPKLPE